MAHPLNLLPVAHAAPLRASASLGGALLALALLLTLVSGWIEWDRRQTLAGEDEAQRQHEAQRAQWQAELGRAAAAGDTRALEQERASARAELAQLQGEFLRHAAADAAPAAWLDWLARHWPSQAWLQRVRASRGRIDIEGYTLAPAELRGWMQQLATTAPQAPLQLTGLRLEQRDVAPWGRVFWFELGAQRSAPEALPAEALR
jgi:hypothetical protein